MIAVLDFHGFKKEITIEDSTTPVIRIPITPNTSFSIIKILEFEYVKRLDNEKLLYRIKKVDNNKPINRITSSSPEAKDIEVRYKGKQLINVSAVELNGANMKFKKETLKDILEK